VPLARFFFEKVSISQVGVDGLECTCFSINLRDVHTHTCQNYMFLRFKGFIHLISSSKSGIGLPSLSPGSSILGFLNDLSASAAPCESLRLRRSFEWGGRLWIALEGDSGDCMGIGSFRVSIGTLLKYIAK
jgi:hypothetical protein